MGQESHSERSWGDTKPLLCNPELQPRCLIPRCTAQKLADLEDALGSQCDTQQQQSSETLIIPQVFDGSICASVAPACGGHLGTSQWLARHMGDGGLYLMSAWFLHNKIFASLTHRSLLVIPFPTEGAAPWKLCSAELSISFHKKTLFSQPHPSFLEEIQTYSLIRGLGQKDTEPCTNLSIRDFQAICLARKFPPICTFSWDAPRDSHRAVAA